MPGYIIAVLAICIISSATFTVVSFKKTLINLYFKTFSSVMFTILGLLSLYTLISHSLELSDNRLIGGFFMVLGLILSGFIFFGVPFVKIWAGSEYGASYAVALLLIIPVTVPLIQNLGIEIQRAKNMHKARAVIYLAIAIANVFISIPLIKLMGPAGAALGTAISLIAGNAIFMNWYYHARIGMNMIYFWKEIAKFIPALIAPCAVGIVIMNFVNITGLVKLGVFAVVYTAVYGLSMYFLGMNEEEKQLVMGPIRKILRK